MKVQIKGFPSLQEFITENTNNSEEVLAVGAPHIGYSGKFQPL